MSEEKDTSYDTGKQFGQDVKDVTGAVVDSVGSGLSTAWDVAGEGAAAVAESEFGQVVGSAGKATGEFLGDVGSATGEFIGGMGSALIEDTWLDRQINSVKESVDAGKKEMELFNKNREAIRNEYLGQGGKFQVNEFGRIEGGSTSATVTEGNASFNGNEIVEERHMLGDGPGGPSHKVEYVLKDGRVIDASERGDAIQIVWKRPDGTEGKEFIDADKIAMIRSFASNKWDAVNGFKLKVVEDAGDALSTIYYEPHEVVGSDYQRRGDQAKRRLNFANTEFTLSNSKFRAAVIRIYELDKKQGRVDPALHALVLSWGVQGASNMAVQRMINGPETVAPTDFTPHTPHDAGLKVNFIIPGTNTNSMIVLSDEQVAAVRSFIRGKRDVNGGYKLMVSGNSGEPFSPLYYQLNTQGNAYVRKGENPSSVAVASSVSTFRLNETQFHAAVMGIMKADAERGYVDPALKQWGDVMLSEAQMQVIKGGQSSNQTGPQTGQSGVQGPQTGPRGGQAGIQGGVQGVQPVIQGGVQGGQGVPIAATTPSDDDKNFFLSAGSWVNGAFASLGNMIPVPLLTNFIKMIGNCIGGLLRTIGYVLEGEWGKAGNELFGWVKDAAVVGGVAYGAYFLKKKLSEYFKSDDSKSSTNSSSTNSSSSSTNTNTDLSDLLAGILNGSTNSGTTTEGTKKDEDVYIGLNHTSNGKVSGTVTTYTDASGTTQRLLDTSDRFLLAGEIRNPDSDGTLWRVKVDKTK